MSIFEFSVSYNGDPQLLPIIFGMKEQGEAQIREIFLSGPQFFSASGRITPGLGVVEFGQLVGVIHEQGIRVNLVMNSTCEGSEWYDVNHMKDMIKYVGFAHQELGVESVTLANPLFIEQLRHFFPNLEICASVLSGIDCVQKAKLFEKAGATVITPDVSINRNLEMLSRIKKATNLELKVMTNEGCMTACPFRQFHFNAISHLGKDAIHVGEDVKPEEYRDRCNHIAFNVFFGHCNSVIDSDHTQILKSGWIRPEDLSLYAGVTSYFKLSGRTIHRSGVENIMRAYMNCCYDGNLLDIMDSSLKAYALSRGVILDNNVLGEMNFTQRVLSCDKHCEFCDFCDEVAERALSFAKFPTFSCTKEEPVSADCVCDTCAEERVFAKDITTVSTTTLD